MTDTPSNGTGSEPPDTGDTELSRFAVRGRLRMRAHAARLFNDGLAAARNGRPDLARDFFSACVFWYPHDADARSALALACLESGDRDTAREHWQQVLDQHPGDQKARRGLDSLPVLPSQPTVPAD